MDKTERREKAKQSWLNLGRKIEHPETEAQPQDLLVQIHKGRGLLLAFVGCAVFWVLVFLLIGGV